jgi:hypothetical protein
MSKPERTHHGDEFGKLGSSAVRGLDAPTIGAPTAITVDGIVERESGRTPSPWSISARAIVIILVVVFVIALIGMLLMLRFAPRPQDYRTDVDRVLHRAPSSC